MKSIKINNEKIYLGFADEMLALGILDKKDYKHSVRKGVLSIWKHCNGNGFQHLVSQHIYLDKNDSMSVFGSDQKNEAYKPVIFKGEEFLIEESRFDEGKKIMEAFENASI